MMTQRRRWGRWVAVALGVVAVVALMVVRAGKAIPVETAVVERGILTVTIDEASTTRALMRMEVTAPASGRFVPAGLGVGDRVAAGAVVGTLHSAPLDPVSSTQATQRVSGLTAALGAASARVEAAQAAAAIAERDAERAQRLFDAGALSQRGLDEARSAATGARNDLAAAREQVRQVEAERIAAEAAVSAQVSGSAQALRVTAPRSGQVLRLYEENARVVLAGTPLAQIGDVSNLEAVIPVLSADAPRVTEGAAVRFAAGAGTDTIIGVVRLVEPAAYTRYSALGVEEQRVNVIADVTGHDGRLGDQFRLDARITVWEGEVLRAPNSALIRTGEGWSVFVVRDGRAQQVSVDVGHRSADAAEVRSGLQAGDVVIVYPGEAIADGTRVAGASR